MTMRDRTRPSSEYWDGEIVEARSGSDDSLWYRYMDRIYRDLVAETLPSPPIGPSLKTDLYEEARGARAPLRHLPEPRIGVDVSPEVVAAARANMKRQGVACELLVADVRRLPLADGSVQFVLSGSTLDHFDSQADLLAGIGELSRVLAPGGALALTLDNPHNPVLWLRRRARRIAKLRLRPYFVGETLGLREGEAALRAAGLEVRRIRAIAHAPRDPAMRLGRVSANHPRLGSGERLLAAMWRCEALERAPTRWRTGYYLAFEAVKRRVDAADAAASGLPERPDRRLVGLRGAVR